MDATILTLVFMMMMMIDVFMDISFSLLPASVNGITATIPHKSTAEVGSSG